MNLSWYSTWNTISRKYTCTDTDSNLTRTNTVQDFYRNMFVTQWRTSLSKQSKMSFYYQIKGSFGEELYLGLSNRNFRSNIAKIRSSSHDLMIEKGRYGVSPMNLSRKVCRFCCQNDDDTMTNFESLPFSEAPIIESEEHVLTECLMYHPLRSFLSDNLKSLLMLKEYGLIMSSAHIKEFGRFLTNCHQLRNPKKSSKTKLQPSKSPPPPT